MNLETFYTICFEMKQKGGYSLSEINKMYPFERDIYVSMLIARIESKENNGQEENYPIIGKPV